jgi:N-acetylneuraminate lyase
MKKVMSNSKFKGIFPALVTPMEDNGSIDHESLARLVKHSQKLGVTGFYVGGSTAEGFILTHEERKMVLETVVEAAGGGSTIIAHVGSISTQEAMELARHAKQLNVDAMSAVVPFYYKTTPLELKEHYASIMSAADLPMIVYHFPGATGVNLSMDFYEEISRNPQCIGVKFTSLNLFEMQQIRARCGDDFLIYNGHDEIYAAGALTGADGAIGSTFNMMAPLFVSMFKLAEAGDWAAVRSAQGQANEVIVHMLNYDVIPYEKYITYLQGISKTYKARQPLKQLSDKERAEIDAFYAGNEVLKAAAREFKQV